MKCYDLTHTKSIDLTKWIDYKGTSSMDVAFVYQVLSFEYSNYLPVNPEAPPASPDEFIEQQKQRIAQQQKTQRKDRIKPWEDKGKKFK